MMMKKTSAAISAAAVLLAAASSAPSSVSAQHDGVDLQLQPRIAFTSTRDHVDPALTPPLLGGELYLTEYVTDDKGRLERLTNPQRLTDNESFDGFGTLSPDGRKLVFDSTRDTGNISLSDLFVMTIHADGSRDFELKVVLGGSSASWSPDSKHIVFHGSASGTGTPRLPGVPGSATTDSDIFVANVDDVVAGVAAPRNLTQTAGLVEDDADWSPDGEQIVYVRHPERELFVLNADGSGTPTRLTNNGEEERGPAWSPDGTKILFSCRTGTGAAELCVWLRKSDGSVRVQQLTNNGVADLTPTWSLDGRQILFHRPVDFVLDGVQRRAQQLHVLDVPADTDICDYETAPCDLEAQLLTAPPAINNVANWGELRVRVKP
jgi:TolB protein